MIELTAQNSVKIQARKLIQENGTIAVHHLHNNTFHTESVCTIYIFSWHGSISKGAQHIALQIMDKGCGTAKQKRWTCTVWLITELLLTNTWETKQRKEQLCKSKKKSS